ncbi:4-hydroxybenzoate polyprenyltransferase [Neolewinella xylanilytica]|uniref:4-hydroxybenzoate polyprenyltransferase n=1 Tax=Neolewinella xylanilytica TaxID=1514080 RepID=A0A2S6I4I6_9BACT|nr:UbiA-like polyprenyltransferase [Neolewinella xylanilytica]PPK86096.1 4-hydroxybenzoate polyprenyltransferase [Neolewinella xylanilytica]
MSSLRRVGDFLSLVKFSHTVFALPFALLGFFLGVMDHGTFPPSKLLLVIGCMIFARSAAMGFNRWLDRDIDRKNVRTAVREIPAGTISARAALVFVLVNAGLFVVTAGFLNPLCLALSPVALLVILGYSYTKRFTFLCHFVLGLGLALAPVGAYLAVTAHWALLPVLYGVVVLLWVSGFDIIYALQDESFDREEELYSIPVRLGARRALLLGRLLHLTCGLVLALALGLQSTVYPDFGTLTVVAGGIFLSMLLYQHTIVTPTDLSRINLAFFTTNGLASLIFGTLVILDMFV